MTAEEVRLVESAEGKKKWRRFGPYLSERQWGTVREDYSANGDAWGYLSHDDARSRAYRWGEDGLLGLTDNRGLLCFAIALWNGKDPILKERLFGLTGPEGNHGEDVKETYFYLTSTPTHSYCHAQYKYPQREFPYDELRWRAREAGKQDKEVDLEDLGYFADDRYFDVDIRYAKADFDDILIEIKITNRGPEAAKLAVLPTFWFRNDWSFGDPNPRPRIGVELETESERVLRVDHPHFGAVRFAFEGAPTLLFTENESNFEKLWGAASASPYVKDAFHRYVVHGEHDAVNPEHIGSKAAGLYEREVGPGETWVVRARMTPRMGSAFPPSVGSSTSPGFDEIIKKRRDEADEFFAATAPPDIDEERMRVYRQALSGLLWSKQYYHLDVTRWLRGDPGQPPPPKERKHGRNSTWGHLYNSEVILMPDKWEYPWYAAWDTAFHAVAASLVDLELAKEQLVLFLREWLMHPNGQIPAYEWAFSDVNPPVQAWAALRIYELEKKRTGKGDRQFLESAFHKLMLNFTWWVNRKDASGKNVFEGGFMGLDNIGVFDRSSVLPNGGTIQQADATSWMGMYCLNLLHIALELARENKTYEDVANKFFEHFLYIADAMNGREGDADSVSLWDDDDGFYYDVLSVRGERIPLRVRTMVGLVPLFAVGAIEATKMEESSGFMHRVRWFLANRPELAKHVESLDVPGQNQRRILALVTKDKLRRILARVLDEKEFLSPFGVRALSAYHRDHPYVFDEDGERTIVRYEPAESQSNLFGGNSNWRGPIWMPMNYLLIHSLRQGHRYWGDSFQIECPTGSGNMMNLAQVADELSRRLLKMFLPNEKGVRPFTGRHHQLANDPNFKDQLLFFEYFDGDLGAGLGARHQTGWTALVADLVGVK